MQTAAVSEIADLQVTDTGDTYERFCEFHTLAMHVDVAEVRAMPTDISKTDVSLDMLFVAIASKQHVIIDKLLQIYTNRRLIDSKRPRGKHLEEEDFRKTHGQ